MIGPNVCKLGVSRTAHSRNVSILNVIGALLFAVTLTSCMAPRRSWEEVRGKEPDLYKRGNRVYPYRASDERTKQIMNGAGKLKAGMHELAVLELMGDPDKALLVNYDMKKHRGRLVGYWFEYVVDQPRERGSYNDKQQKWSYVHIKFSPNRKVTSFRATGLPQFQPE